jgi:prepilin-type N-terminal cleavage/methylation domain-containing protein
MYSLKLSHSRQGFTLIELLVVIVIIGLLTSLATTSYLTAQRNSRDNARKVRLNTVANGVETYYRVNQKFPGQLGKGVAPSAGYASAVSGCEQYDASTDGFVYAYYPTDIAGVGAQQACNLRNTGAVITDATNGYTLDPTTFKPFPSWVPGLGDYVNPMPIETRYKDSAGTDTGVYDLSNDPLNSVNNVERTYVYRKLLGGYMLYTTLENSSDRDVVAPQTFTDTPKFPNGTNIQLLGNSIYMLRK